MDVNSIFNMGRKITHTTTGQQSNSDLLPYLNLIYHDTENQIVSTVNEDFFYEIFTADLVAGQNEYTLETSSSTNEGMKKIIQLEVLWENSQNNVWSSSTAYVIGDKVSYNSIDYTCRTAHTSTSTFERQYWDATSYYNKLDYKSIQLDIEDSRDEILQQTSQNNGFYDIKDSSIFLYPIPRNNVTNGLRMSSIINLIDLVDGGAETTVFPNHTELRQYHYVLALGLAEYIYRFKDEEDKAIAAKVNYENEKKKLMSFITDRYDNFTFGELPKDRQIYL